jgi:hypothetical protein
MTNNNYILARWRDASTDPPPSGWCGLNIMANGARYYGACGYMPGDQWLDITAIPGVAREAVQAAVDRLVESSVPSDCECPTCDAIRAMCRELGVAPSVAEEPSVAQEAPHA